jgi:hypothetical protein
MDGGYHLNEQVDMIGFAVAFCEGAIETVAGVPRNLLKAFQHGGIEDLTAVPGYKNQVVVNCVNCVA